MEPASLIRRFLAFSVLSIALGQCAHDKQASPAATEAKNDWQMVSRDPLTYAPKGFTPPAAGSYDAVGAEYVYLADRKTRFYVPPRKKEFRAQALAIREASKNQADKMHENAEAVVEGVLRGGVWLLYLTARGLSGS